MALWPFLRRGSRAHPHANIAAETDSIRGTARRQTEPPNRLAKVKGENDRAYSFSPGRRDSIRASRHPNEAMSRSNTRRRSKRAAAIANPASRTDDVHRVPTLHHENSGNKRSGQPLLAKKSSKRRKEEHEREAEIKAMSQFTPVRPATDVWTKGRPVKRDSRRHRSELEKSWDGQPSSAVSLPSPESIHSSMSSDSDHMSFRISALAALAPRPTIRCSSNPVSGPGLGRSPSERRRLADRQPISEETLKAHKQIDNLADDLDASDLRELMERDQRRRQRKREKDMQKAEKKLARRMERQREEADRAGATGTQVQNLERGVLGRELVGLEDPASVRITSAPRRDSEERVESDFEKNGLPKSSVESDLKNHEEMDHPGAVTADPADTQAYGQVTPDPSPHRNSRPKSTSPTLMGFIRSKRSGSKSPSSDEARKARAMAASPSPSQIKPDYAESTARTSDSGSARPWLSFLKWGGRRRSSVGPASFSNTSRDSMQGSHTGPPPVVSFSNGRRLSSGVPKRTMSRFREDLPEQTLSPPDSRVGSPDVTVGSTERLPQIADNAETQDDMQTESAAKPIPIPARREDLQASPAPHSMSLASIGSEGSWLSGRMSRQSRQRASSGAIGSSTVHPMASASAISEMQTSDHTDDDSIAADEYLNKVVPSSPIEPHTPHAHASSDEESSYRAQWGSVSRKPTVVRGAANKRSREGLLVENLMDKDLETGSTSSEDDKVNHSPLSKDYESGVRIQRLSAGSAKLLDMPPRQSGEERVPVIERGTQ